MLQPSMTDVARAALYNVGGVTYRFDNVDYPTPEACRKAMVKFRNAFYAFKAKERRRIKRELHTEVTMYDGLGCSIDEVETGWSLTISESTYDPSKFVNAEGKPIDWAALRADSGFTQEEIEAALKDMPRNEPVKLFDH